MSVSKLPLLSHGVHSTDSFNFAKEPAALSVLLPCPSQIRLFSPFFTTAIGGSGVVKCRGTRHSRGGDESLRRENGLGFVEEDGDDEERGERKVRCEVDVISWRERRIRGEIWVDSDSQSVWDVLTDYERLADFIPNLVCSGRIPCPHPGRIWLEQRGLQRALYWHIEARVVLDLHECPDSPNGRELHFSMVDGDFKKFEGKWSVKSGIRSVGAVLSYEVNVIPRFNFPAIFLERIIRSDLPVNLRAVARQAEINYKAREKPSIIDALLGRASVPSTPSHGVESESPVTERSAATSSVGSLSHSNELNNNWGVYGKVCKLDKPCTVDEVHLRRFDGLLENGGVHRCAVASITVKAPVCEVWKVLTAYESLPEIVPNLAISKILSRENNKVRILQEGCKGLLYMVLHARAVLDLHETREQEIRFEQVEGDFDSLEGKWIFEQLGNHHTLLKYTVESKMRKDTFLSEAIMEEVIYEDLPSNLCAIRDYIEKRGEKSSETCKVETCHVSEETCYSSRDTSTETVKNGDDCADQTKQRARIPGLQRDIEVLKSEILKFISEHGQEGFMPMRKQLRSHGRVDIEKAITRMGGFRRIAVMMNLSLAYKYRKPKGYWDNLENLQEEIGKFQQSWGMDPSFMPSRKTFERAGRYDIARALEKWGGLHEVSRLLALNVRHPSRQLNSRKDNGGTMQRSESIDTDLNSTLSSKKNKPYVSQDTEKWLYKLKDLDINWVQ
ncbi:hypothetical protein HID58_039493 [Brassica napus]|uniref:Coenzyme Q-binding protein COQ10 START domain-containing protein n=1 Tax=Brassica napus TaxID=3708 RepID=A0ABQ8BS67_BRANA|nr:uncharacterized protein LOC106419404 [Brassica napus]KAH0907666.1 hypothetical protein HID58_039493 [Brassica napus]